MKKGKTPRKIPGLCRGEKELFACAARIRNLLHFGNIEHLRSARTCRIARSLSGSSGTITCRATRARTRRTRGGGRTFHLNLLVHMGTELRGVPRELVLNT